MRFDGQLSTYKAFLREAGQPETHPCYRCLFGDQPADFKGSCADVGVLGALAGVLGTLQAVEVIKELLGIGRSFSGRLLLYDSLETSFREVRVKPDPACPLCGTQASIVDLSSVDYGGTAGCAA
jgi:adenylyltransferase/sulfurtransferase